MADEYDYAPALKSFPIFVDEDEYFQLAQLFQTVDAIVVDKPTKTWSLRYQKGFDATDQALLTFAYSSLDSSLEYYMEQLLDYLDYVPAMNLEECPLWVDHRYEAPFSVKIQVDL